MSHPTSTTHRLPHRRRPRTRFRRSLPALTVLALVASVLAVGMVGAAAPASAAAPSGYVPSPNWTVGATATTTLPGNAAAFGSEVATNDSAGQQLIVGSGTSAIDGVTVPRFLPTDASVRSAGASCVQGRAVGVQNTCATYGVTFTLPHPVVDPVVAIGMGGGGAAGGSWCTAFWYDIAFAAVNGAAPGSGAVTPLGSTDNFTFASNTLSLPQSYISAHTCSAPGLDNVVHLRLHGLVSSFSLADIYRGEVTSNPDDVAVGPSSIGGMTATVLVPSADLAITKTAPATVAPGGTIQWAVTVTDNGPSDSHGFVVHDAIPADVTGATLVSGPAGCSLSGTTLTCADAPPGCAAAQDPTVATAADLTCAAATDADATVLAAGASFGPIVLRGHAPTTKAATVTNTATVSGVDSDPVTGNNRASVVTTTTPPALSLVKTADVAVITAVGQVVHYSFLITNTGSVTMRGIAVDEFFGGAGTLSAVTCPSRTLLPGQSVTCAATYTVVQADLDAGSVTNTAVATGTPPAPTTPVPTLPSTVTIPVPRHPALTVLKSAASGGKPVTAIHAGQVIEYAFVVTNTGNVTLTGVHPVDRDFTGSGALSAIRCPDTTLAPGAQTRCTASYTVTRTDVDAGTVSNSASATGTPPTGPAPTAPPSTVTVPSTPAPRLSLVKTADVTTITTVGQVIHYTFVVTNTGSATLTTVHVHEGAFSGTGTLSPVACPTGSLAPGARLTCTASYTVTRADLATGSLTNTATATATTPTGGHPTSPASTAEVTIAHSIDTGAPGDGTRPSTARTAAGIGLVLAGLSGLLLVAGHLWRRRTGLAD